MMTVREAFVAGYRWAKKIGVKLTDLEATVYLALVFEVEPYPGLVDAFCDGSRSAVR